jgi:hypothetical protein
VLATLLAAALICAASALVGEALARVLGLERSRGWSPAVGLAVLLAASLAAVKLPGHGTTGAMVVGLLVAAAALVLWRSDDVELPGWDVVALTGTTVLAALIPYVANGRFGILGLSFNNDLSAHIPWTRALADPDVVAAVSPTSGYPVGPHSLVAALSSATGIEVQWAFTGLLLALLAMIGWAALPLLDGLSRPRRLLGALLVSVAYAVSAFYVQAGFKELTLTLLLVALVGIARAAARRPGRVPGRLGIQVGALGAGLVISFSYGSLAWPLLALAAWAVLAAVWVLAKGGRRGLGVWLRSLRTAVPAALYAIATGAVLLAADLPRLIDSLSVFGASPAGTGALTSSGHLLGEVSKREAFGFWPREDFRFGYEQTFLNEALGILAAAVALYALVWWLARRDLALPAAVAATMAIAVYLSETESAYTASKALAPAGALVMAMSARALLADPPPSPRLGGRLALATVAAVFALAALWSSFLVLRGAQVGPRAHSDDLAALRPLLGGEPTLFLGHQDFLRADLPGVPVIQQPTAQPLKRWTYGDPFDLDSLTADELDELRYAILPRTLFQSSPPPNFRHVKTAGSYELWRRNGPTPQRRTLAEGSRPGVVLDCSKPAARALARRKGWARVWPVPPRVLAAGPSIRSLPAGGRGGMGIPLYEGKWELSLQYVSPQELDITIDGRSRSLPASLDRPGPWWRIGTTERDSTGGAPLRLAVEDDALGAANHFASVLAVAAVSSNATYADVPLREACYQYVDWYVLGTEPPGPG